jgi:hypothetical protein
MDTINKTIILSLIMLVLALPMVFALDIVPTFKSDVATPSTDSADFIYLNLDGDATGWVGTATEEDGGDVLKLSTTGVNQYSWLDIGMNITHGNYSLVFAMNTSSTTVPQGFFAGESSGDPYTNCFTLYAESNGKWTTWDTEYLDFTPNIPTVVGQIINFTVIINVDTLKYDIWVNNQTPDEWVKGITDQNPRGTATPIDALKYYGHGTANSWVDEIAFFNGTDYPEQSDVTPPALASSDSAGCTSCVPYESIVQQPWETDDTTPTINASMDEAATCAIIGANGNAPNYNYSDTIAKGGVECTTTGGTPQTCTIQASNSFNISDYNVVCVGCKDASAANELLNATFCANITVTDTTRPEVNTSVSNSSPKINEVLNISANITDNIALSFCQAIQNQTGEIIYTNYSLGGESRAECSNITTIKVVRGNVINFTIRANDTSNNVHTNDTIITVGDTIATVPININDSSVNTGDVVNISSNPIDSDNLSWCLIKHNQSGAYTNNSYRLSGTTDECSDKTTVTVSRGSVINFVVEINDSVGGIVYENSTLVTVVDTTPPDVAIINPINSTSSKSSEIDLYWTSSEESSWCAYSVDGGANDTSICDGIGEVNITLENIYDVNMINASIRMNLARDLEYFDEDKFADAGSGIRFTDDNGVVLNSFVEHWKPKERLAIVWFNTSILAKSNKTVYLTYGNESLEPKNDNLGSMLSWENFSSGNAPGGWSATNDSGGDGLAGFDYDSATVNLNGSFAAYFWCAGIGIDCDDASVFPVLPPSTNYTIDFWFYSVGTVDNGYFFDGATFLQWQNEENNADQPQVVGCKIPGGADDPMNYTTTNKWIRAVIHRDREKDKFRVTFYQNESIYGQCNGTSSNYGSSQSRTDWSFSSGNNVGTSERVVIDNFKIYKSFGYNTSDIAIYVDEAVKPKNTSFNVSGEGFHNVTVAADDLAGNTGHSNITFFTVDSGTPPSLVGSDAWCLNCSQKLDNQPWVSNYTTISINFTTNESATCSILGEENLYCYQEHANVSTNCAGFDNGTYGNHSSAASFSNLINIYDGDYSTYANSSGVLNTVYFNYTKPTYAKSAIWQVKDEKALVNLTILDGCYNRHSDKIELRYRDGSGIGGARWECYSGSWNTLRTITGLGASADIYEEGIWWRMRWWNNTNSNYTDILSYGGVDCESTGGTNHNCTIMAINDFTIGDNKTLCVGCKDVFGNEFGNATFCAEVNITDNVSPNIIFNYPPNNVTFVVDTNNSITFNFTANDSYWTSYEIKLEVNGSLSYYNDSYINGSNVLYNETLSRGAWQINVTAMDNHSNRHSYFLNITILDETPPEFTGFYCKNCLGGDGDGTEVYTSYNRTPLFNITTSEDCSCYISDSNSSYDVACEDTGSSSHNCTLSSLDSLEVGQDFVYVNCTDPYLNTNTEELEMYINITPIHFDASLCSGIDYIWFQLPPNNFTGYNISADGQINDNCTINVTNLDTKNGTVKLYSDITSINHTLWGSFNNCTTSKYKNITTVEKTMGNVLVGESALICLWMDYISNTSYTYQPEIFIEVWDYDDGVT